MSPEEKEYLKHQRLLDSAKDSIRKLRIKLATCEVIKRYQEREFEAAWEKLSDAEKEKHPLR